jgi:hypothetical protein
MGWDYCKSWQTKEDIIRELTKSPQDRPENVYTCLAHSTSGNQLWAVWEGKNKETGKTERFIGLDLLQYSRGSFGGCWGHKGMDESMGPYSYDVPQKFLDMVPERNPDWRARVRAYKKVRAAKKRSVQIGQKWKLKDGCKPPVVCIVGNSPRIIGEYLGSQYRIAPRLLDCQIQ